MEQYKDENHDNLVSKTIKWQSNIVINSFEDKSNVGYKIINANHNCCFEKDFQNIINSQK